METFQGGKKLSPFRDGRIEGTVAQPFWWSWRNTSYATLILVVYRGISHETIVFSRYSHDPFILYHSIEKTVASTINLTCAQTSF